MSATFAAQRAFQPGRARSQQVEDLNDIRAVLPLEAADTCSVVWAAMHDATAVPAALRALEALPEPVRAEVISRADQIARVSRRAA